MTELSQIIYALEWTALARGLSAALAIADLQGTGLGNALFHNNGFPWCGPGIHNRTEKYGTEMSEKKLYNYIYRGRRFFVLNEKYLYEKGGGIMRRNASSKPPERHAGRA